MKFRVSIFLLAGLLLSAAVLPAQEVAPSVLSEVLIVAISKDDASQIPAPPEKGLSSAALEEKLAGLIEQKKATNEVNLALTVAHGHAGRIEGAKTSLEVAPICIEDRIEIYLDLTYQETNYKTDVKVRDDGLNYLGVFKDSTKENGLLYLVFARFSVPGYVKP